MASVSQQIKLPFIDFSNGGHKLSPEDPEWPVLRAQVRRAAEEFGCFAARFDSVPMDLQKAMIGLLPELFDLPLETKLRNVSSKEFHGYLGQFALMPLYESLGINNSDQIEKVEENVRELWPEGHPTFSKTVQSYSDNLSTLDRIVRRMILESLGLEKYVEEHLDSTYYLLRVQKYKEPHTPETKLGVQEHTDRNTMTILHQNQVDGLETQSKDGEWISLKPSPESFIIVIGDSLHAWTNGRVHSPKHRVMISGSEARYSVGLFSVSKAGYIVKAPDELVDVEHPLLFGPFDYAEFLDFYWTEYVKGADSSLKAYCGFP